jgi:hypothetical protein
MGDKQWKSRVSETRIASSCYGRDGLAMWLLHCCCWQLHLIFVLQAPGTAASDAATLRVQLAAARTRAQAAAAEAATLQRRLDSERAAATCRVQQLEAAQRRPEAERRRLEAGLQQLGAERRQAEAGLAAARGAAAERRASLETWQRRTQAHATHARAELDSLQAQMHATAHISAVTRPLGGFAGTTSTLQRDTIPSTPSTSCLSSCIHAHQPPVSDVELDATCHWVMLGMPYCPW